MGSIPRGQTTLLAFNNYTSNSSVSSNLLDASFGIESEIPPTSSLLGAIDKKIKDLQQRNCMKNSQSNSDNCYDTDIDAKYLPSPDELLSESIFLNGSSVVLSSLKNEFEYALQMGTPTIQTETVQSTGSTQKAVYKGYLNGNMFIMTSDSTLAQARENCELNAKNNPGKSIRCTWDEKDINTYPLQVSYTTSKLVQHILSYTLKYKKEYYTLAEAREFVDKKQEQVENSVYLSDTQMSLNLPCQGSTSYMVRSQCTAALADFRSITTAMGAHYADTETYPQSIESMNRAYFPNTDIRERFNQNFSYTPIFTSGAVYSYEIRYIGAIGEGMMQADTIQQKPDYKSLLSGAVIPEIPQIFSHVPADAMVLYVKNPENILSLLHSDEITDDTLFLDTHKSIQNFIFSYFGIKDISRFSESITHEFALVVMDMDSVNPEIVLIIDDWDAIALDTEMVDLHRISKDWFTILAASEETLKIFATLTIDKSLQNAWDFQYLWTKKSSSIQDAFVFVGDAFFEKMLTLENYIRSHRKNTDYKKLQNLQELVWAYAEAFGQPPKDFSEFTQLGFQTFTGELLTEYTIDDDIVSHKNIGSLKSLNTLTSANYDIDKISRNEIEAYKYSVLKYREVWQAALDPMGIVINRYRDGIDIDFFMTPIPHLDSAGMQDIRNFFEWTTKKSLSFITNPAVRIWILSFVWGFDTAKIQEKIQLNPEIATGFAELSDEILGGKNIFDYLGWEFAFTLGDIDPDIIDGWNIERVDMHFAIQTQSEEKWKELIDAIRTNILDKQKQFNQTAGTLGDMGETDILKWFFAKPLIEEYRGKQIFYLDGASVPYIGKLSIAYTFIDDFLYVGLNRGTMKNIIDIANTGDIRKKQILSNDVVQENTFFSVLFDGVATSNTLKNLYNKNQENIWRYTRIFDLWGSSGNSELQTLLGKYYVTQYINKRLGKDAIPFDYTLGGLSVIGDIDALIVHLDEKQMDALTGTILESWDTARSGTGFPMEIFSEQGIKLEVLLAHPDLEIIISSNLVVALQKRFESENSLLNNIIFSLSMWDDEIGFKIRIFEKDESENIAPTISNLIPPSIPKDILIVLIIFIILALVGGFWYVVYKRRQWTINI